MEKVKSFISANKSDLYVAAIIFLVGLSSFGLGRLSILWPTKEPITITSDQLQIINTISGAEQPVTVDSKAPASTLTAKGKYVASKSGTAYHYQWCPSAQKIKEENKVWFETKEAAEKAGYKPAGNCEGL